MIRSYLFVPGNDAGKLAAASTRGADALVVDLEDAVPPGAKVQARREVAAWLQGQSSPAGQIWVRVNNDAMFADDLAAVAQPAVSGVVVPKIADAEEAQARAAVLAAASRGNRPLGFFPLIETARALIDVDAIAATPGLTRLMLGEYDLAAELGIELSDSGSEMITHRARLVLACAAAGVAPPVAPVSTNYRDEVLFREASISLKRIGYVGRAVIHPAQVAIANDVFSPAADEIEAARRLVMQHERAVAAGRGVTTDDQGRMVDEAVVRSARHMLDIYDPGPHDSIGGT